MLKIIVDYIICIKFKVNIHIRDLRKYGLYLYLFFIL